MITEDEFTKVIIAGVYETDEKGSEMDFEHSMEELGELSRACYLKPVGRVTQTLDHRTAALYLGAGKVEEIAKLVKNEEAETVVLNDTLTPIQIRNLSKEFGVSVMDRTALILEIFKDRARTREAKLQVELARLQYMKPRLIGMWEKQNRQGGASGSMSSKGEGETQLEIDRRTIDHRLSELRKELKVVERERQTQRKRRQNARIPLVALVGYTNAGKSTIMNAFVDKFCKDEDKKVFEANMLFATLDTTVRRIETGKNKDFLLSDTVGFIQKLPTGLVEAFKSTLEEVKEADLILQVVDYSDEHYKDHMATTQETITSLGAGDVPIMTVYNKADLRDDEITYPRVGPDGSVYISAREDSSIELLKDAIIEKAYGDYVDVEFLIPYTEGDTVAYLIKNSQVESQTYTDEGTIMKTRCHSADFEKFRRFIKENENL